MVHIPGRRLSSWRLEHLPGRWSSAWGAERCPSKCQGWEGGDALGLLLFCLSQEFPWGNDDGYWPDTVNAELLTPPHRQEADADCSGSSEYIGYFCPKMLVVTKSRGIPKGQRVRHVLDPSLPSPELSPARVEGSAKQIKISQALASFFFFPNYFLGNSCVGFARLLKTHRQTSSSRQMPCLEAFSPQH